jgi:uncharacterized membrane protein YccC
VLARLVRDGIRLDRTQSDPVVAGRNALGVAAPLIIGAVSGAAAFGLPSTIGALQTAFADRPGPYRLRVLRMLGTAFAAATTSALAVAASKHDVASVVLLFVIAFVAGLLVSGGPSATQVGIASTAAALVLGHQVQQPGAALHVAVLVFAGGAGQTLLAVAGWPLRRHRPERSALAGLYSALAGLARQPTSTSVGPPLGDVFASVRSTLYGLGHDHGPSVEAYRVLLDEAERMRRELVLLGGYADRLGEPAGDEHAAAVLRSVLADAARALDEVAAALTAGRPVDMATVEPVRTRVRTALTVLDHDEGSAVITRRAAAARVRGLAGQLRATVEATGAGASEGASDGVRPAVTRAPRLRDPVAVLRANLSPGSTVLRHAVRTSVLVAGSDLVLRLDNVNRGYWVPLTVLVVLRPDFATTFQRVVLRVVGTIVGLVVMSELVHWVPGGQWYAIVLIGLLFFGMRLAGPGNMAIGAACLSGLVVVLLSLAGVAPHATVVRRGVDTVIGGALALAAILLRPSWERDVLPQRLAELLSAYRDYTDTVADVTYDPARLQRARSAARLARSNAEASVDRAEGEPVGSRSQVELGRAVLAHTHRYVHAVLTLEALRPVLRERGMPPALAELFAAAHVVLDRCTTAVRGEHAPLAETSLRVTQEQLVEQLEARRPTFDADVSAALLDATDRMVNSLDTLVAELRRQLSEPSGLTSVG